MFYPEVHHLVAPFWSRISGAACSSIGARTASSGPQGAGHADRPPTTPEQACDGRRGLFGADPREHCGSTVRKEDGFVHMGKLSIQEWKWWQKFSACLRMPRGGMQGTGSQACSFEYSVPSDRVLSVLMEGLPFRQRQVWERGNWVPSKTIDTFYALDVKTLDTYLQLHRRDALKHMPGFYRGSRLISPADSKLMCVLLCIVPPMLFEVCHRSGKRVELVASFKLYVYNDLDAFSMPPHFQYATGMDLVFKERALDHLKALHVNMPIHDVKLSAAFANLVTAHEHEPSESEDQWSESEDEALQWRPAKPARRPGVRLSRSSSDEEEGGSDSASDAAMEENLNAEGEGSRRPHHSAFPRSAHLQSPYK